MKETLGQYLRRKRESHLISLEDIARATGISIPLIKALEEDNFHVIPRSEMSMKYLKKYAAHLRLNKKDVVHRYEMQYDPTNQTKHLPQLSLFSSGNVSYKQVKAEKSLFKKPSFQVVFWSSIILWALVFFSLYIHITAPKKDAHESGETPQSKVVKKEMSRARTAPTDSVASRKSQPSPDQAAGTLADSPAQKPSAASVPLKHEVKHDVKREDSAKEFAASAPIVAPSQGKAKVIGNSDSKRYHLPGMKYYLKVKTYHQVI
ncbi:MAG: helix-turn-helix domain-containing protein, partial [Syntrophales bacterium LBB04]|nr:helix-turn-helix domain-containing protein [Syntrophales bacterium LBB04]